MNNPLLWNDRHKLKNVLHEKNYNLWILTVPLMGMVVLAISLLHNFSSTNVSDQEALETSPDMPSSSIAKKIAPSPPIHHQEQKVPLQETLPAANSEKMFFQPSELLDEMMVLHGDVSTDLTPEDLADIQRFLHMLAEYGPGVSPSIRKFLNSGDNILFEDKSAKDSIGYLTLRLALISILSQFEYDEDAELAFLEVLYGTADPMEIAAVSTHLQTFAPDYYHQEILNITQNALSVADSTGLEGRNVGPLFQVLQNFGDENVAAMLEELPPLWWGRYASIALANLPDGKGIPALVKTVQRFDAHKNLHSRFALKMLAQAAANYTQASEALADTVSKNSIPDYLWPEVAALASGISRFQIEDPNSPIIDEIEVKPLSVSKNIAFTPGGNQITYSVQYPVTLLSEKQTEQHLLLIDNLMTKTSNPIAIQSLLQMQGLMTHALKESQF